MSNDTKTKRPQRLFGAPGDEWLDGDVYTAAERVLDACYPAAPDEAVVEEWSVQPAAAMVPSADRVVERLIEDLADDCPHEGILEHLPSERDPALIEAAEALVTRVAERITFSLADKRVARHVFRKLPPEPGRIAWHCDELDVTVSFPERSST